MKVAQVVPVLSASNHGIIDYARRIVTCVGEQPVRPHLFTTELAAPTAFSLIGLQVWLAAVGNHAGATVFFHFDYGSYGWWDLPVWLPAKVRQMRRETPEVRWVFFFHEFHPFTPRRRRERLLWPLTQTVMGWVLDQADLAVCTNPPIEAAIRRLRPAAPILRVPVFSNVGEPGLDACCRAKEPGRWVVFGSTGNLPGYLRRLLNDLPRLPADRQPRALDILGGMPTTECADLGKELARQLRGSEVRYRPDLSADECSAALGRASYCYLPYFEPGRSGNPTLILKSGVFAAANAHGLVTVVGGADTSGLAHALDHPGLGCRTGERFELPEATPALAVRVHAWYHRHNSLGQVCRRLRKAIREIAV